MSKGLKGRPPKEGPRYPCGKRTPEALEIEARETEEEILSTAVGARMRVYGLKATKSYIVRDKKGNITSELTGKQIAKTNILGSPLQRLQHWNYITREQAEAGHSFAETMREYISTAKLNRSTPSKAGFVPAQPDNSDGPPVKGEAKARAYMEALAEIDRSDPFSGPSTTSVVWDVCINETDRNSIAERGALRVGLNAIHRIYHGRKAA